MQVFLYFIIFQPFYNDLMIVRIRAGVGSRNRVSLSLPATTGNHIFSISSSASVFSIRVKPNHFFPKSLIEAPMR